MTGNPLSLPVGVDGIRMFAGYRSMERDKFFEELGQSFMPGTPAALAELGLAAYLPAVLDLDTEQGLPDEIALIVYASRDVYTAARSTVRGRMYTHSHAGVFDMARSRGQWPGTVDQPEQLQGTDRWSWCVFDRDVDWQRGFTRVLFIGGAPGQEILQELLRAAKDSVQLLADAEVDQALFLASTNYAAIWLHGPKRPDIDPSAAGFVPAGMQILRDMDARPMPMPNLVETFSITGAGAYSFQFVRDLRFFL
jgi:hypothetical protein